ncbi:MAG: calcium/sodium antiporter [Lachnospiraceae bacterium]|nr:calcium/sodium antiporter [Lachnospiraceae bacterium]
MLLYIVLLIASFVALIKGADIFVDGSTGIAKIFHVSGLVIGLTVVALGTSAPELAVSTAAAIRGSNEIALSNVIGSNLFNALMVLGIGACIRSLPVEDSVIKRDFPVSIVASVFVLIVTGIGVLPFKFTSMGMLENTGTLVRPAALLLLAGFVVYLAFLVIEAGKNPEQEEGSEKISILKSIIMIIFGIALIVAGGQGVVFSAQNIARSLGLSETLIGLTVVAVGTSLPELVTSLVAAGKGETSLAVGNAVGSNIFNIMFILGVSCSIHPVSANVASIYDLLILIGISLITWIFCSTGRRLTRLEGAFMVLCYIGTMAFAIIR